MGSENDEPCKHYDVLKQQIDRLDKLPAEVHRTTGTVYLIGGLFTLLVGLAFNAHFETLSQSRDHGKRFDAISSQIKEMSDEHLDSKYKLSERLIRIENTLKNDREKK